MSRKLLVLSACLAFFAAAAFADEKDKKDEDKTKGDKITVEAADLSVARKLDLKQFPFSNARAHVNLYVIGKGRQFLGVDTTSKLTTFKDDKDNSLIEEKSLFPTNFSNFPQIAKDRTAMLVGVSSSFGKGPGKGATKLTIKGD